VVKKQREEADDYLAFASGSDDSDDDAESPAVGNQLETFIEESNS